MKKIFLFPAILIFCFSTLSAQITITEQDMPVAGDTLRYSIANPITFQWAAGNTGADYSWDFSQATPIAQGVDTYKKAISVSVTYGATISPSAYGYKVADSFPGLSSAVPLTIKDIYTFFNKKNNPSRFIAEGFAARISGIPTPANYSDEDEWYFFPLTYGNQDTSTFALTVSLPTAGTLKMKGTRITEVDGWGTITTPFFTTPVNCIRVKSTVEEIDSITVAGFSIGIPRATIEYRFLAKGEAYPALWVTSTVVAGLETVSSIRYRDIKRQLGVEATPPTTNFRCYPNPAGDGFVEVVLPEAWVQFQLSVFDAQGRRVRQHANTRQINLQGLAPGTYIVLAEGGGEFAYSILEKR